MQVLRSWGVRLLNSEMVPELCTGAWVVGQGIGWRCRVDTKCLLPEPVPPHLSLPRHVACAHLQMRSRLSWPPPSWR